MERRIVSHHIGGRYGNRPFPVLRDFERDLINVLYDADADCVRQMKRANEDLESKLYVLPYCIGGQNRKNAPFNINRDPFTSSLRTTDAAYAEWSYYAGRYSGGKNRYDYIVGETFAPIEKRRIEVRTLDTILAEEFKLPRPDILTIDTQGTEYDILRGSPKALDENILAVIAEVEFHPIYKGQKLFGDIAALLGESGFHFTRFTKYILEYSPVRAPIGLRGRGFQNATDALFLKSIESVESIKSVKRREIAFRKLAFIALVFDHFEYALACLERAGNIRGSCAYEKFLTNVKLVADRHPRTFPPTFAEHYTDEESTGRFSSDAFVPPITFSTRGAHVEEAPNTSLYADSPVEKLLRKYDLGRQADTIKSVRIEQA